MPNVDGLAVYLYQVMCIKFHRGKFFGEVGGSGLRLVVREGMV
jgi:hypothetical protein